MKRPFKHPTLLVTAVLMALAHPASLQACAVCYGEPDSPMSRGLTWAITALAVTVFVVLMGVVAFFVQANRRATTGNQPALTAENGTQ